MTHTIYESHVLEANAALEQARLVVIDNQSESYDERSDLDSLWMSTAETEATLALAEQQRIANLLTVAIDRQSPVGRPVFNHEARETARDEALAALGLPVGGWEDS